MPILVLWSRNTKVCLGKYCICMFEAGSISVDGCGADRSKPVRSVTYSPDGKLFAASDDMHINVYDTYVGGVSFGG